MLAEGRALLLRGRGETASQVQKSPPNWEGRHQLREYPSFYLSPLPPPQDYFKP